ncbi:MAG: helix-turn-helix domain-containing protein [Alphaproteobacteria bacterium]|nr:helix-turn-helix domain-containing protein [Alphaproteobacteria bacterium]
MANVAPTLSTARTLSHRERREPSPSAITYTLPDAARLSGLSPATLRRRAKEGSLRLVRVGRRTLADGASLRRLLGVDGA